MGRTLLTLSALVALAIPVSAQAQPRSATTPAVSETYVIDSQGTTIYRNGVPVCRVNCWAGADRVVVPDVAPQAASMPAPTLAAPPARPVWPGRPIPAQPLPVQATPAQVTPAQATPATGIAETRVPEHPPGRLTKEQKALVLNAGVAAAVMGYGLAFWDYFQTAPKASSEGWFGRTTSNGGMDKLGHMWTSYSISHLYSYVYRWWDFDAQTANTLGALSGLGVQTAIELGDAFSGSYGFSYEDAVMNAVGAGTAFVLGRYPWLARKIDLRLEYKPSELSDLTDDILTDYEHQRYLLALKLDGFDMFHESALSYLELHLGYQARGYDDFRPSSDEDNRRRSLYFGVGFNVSKLVKQYANIGVFDYLQIPYTSVGVKKGLD